MTKTNKIFEECLSKVDPQIKAEVRAKADAYIGHPQEIDEDVSVTACREAYQKGYQEADKDALNAHSDYWYNRLREILREIAVGFDISVTGEIVKFRNKFLNHD